MASGRVVSIDGVLHAPSDATVSVFDRGFLYGDAVFEVLRTYGGILVDLGEHLARLRRSAERVFIELPLDEARFATEIRAAVDAAGGDESYVRIVVTRGTGPLSLDPDTAERPLRVVFVEPVTPPSRGAYVDGIAVATVQARRAVDDTRAQGAKVGNYLSNLLAIREAKAQGAQEALVVDGERQVVEGASSNVFVVLGERVTTPPESAGILVGITRSHVLGAARALGMAVDERRVPLEELYAATEVFITSSIREVVPVVQVDGRVVGTGRPGPVTRRLHRQLRDDLGMAAKPMPYDP